MNSPTPNKFTLEHEGEQRKALAHPTIEVVSLDRKKRTLDSPSNESMNQPLSQRLNMRLNKVEDGNVKIEMPSQYKVNSPSKHLKALQYNIMYVEPPKRES